MGKEFGRVGGQMLKSDLIRRGIDLAFETDLLFLNVNDKLVGINTDGSTRDLEVNNSILTTDLIVDTENKVGNLKLNGNTITTSVGQISLDALGPNSYFSVPALETNNLRFNNNVISSFSNSNIELRPYDTRKTVIGSIGTPTLLNVTGDLHSTGNIRFDGNIIFGSDSADSVDFNADINSPIVPDAPGYTLGTSANRWKSVETILFNGAALSVESVTAGSESIDLTLRPGNTYFVSKNGLDANVGDHQSAPFLTVAKALSVAQSGDTVYIYPGTYSETLPLTVPVGVTVKGNNLRTVKITPATGYESKDVFLLNGETTVEDLTIVGHLYDSALDVGYAFRFAPNFKVVSRSPYIKNITVLTHGSVTSGTDPYGFDQGDAGKGALVDGSVVDATSKEASMLFHAATFITPGVDCITMTNGVRVEWLNSFTYYANRGLYATNGSLGFASLGTRFGAEIRSIGSANIYGNYGAVADGANTLMYLIEHNFAYVGTGKDNKNDKDLIIQANEVVELNSGQVRYVTQDQGGDFRVGDAFYVDFKTGSTSISATDLGVIGLSSITFKSGDEITYITANTVDTGNFRISQDTIRTTVGGIELHSSSQQTNITTNAAITGNLDVEGNVTVGGQVTVGNQPFDTAAIVGKVASNINPDVTGVYDLGTASKQWANIVLSNLNLDDIRISGNVIRTTRSNSDFELIANGTGLISVPLSSTIIAQDLTVTQSTATKSAEVQGRLSITGNTLLSGNITQTGNKTIDGLLTVDNIASLNNVRFNTNFVTSIVDDSNLVLGAAGTGKILVQPEVNIANNLLVVGNINVPNVTVIGDASGNVVTTSFIKIQDNYITTLNGNDSLDLRASGTGKILAPQNAVVFNNDLTVSGYTDIKSVDIAGTKDLQGSLTLTGNIAQTGSGQVSNGIVAGDSGYFGNVRFTTNWLGTTSGNLDLRASGTGLVTIPTNNVTVNNNIYAGDTTFASVSIVAGVSATVVTNTDLTLTTNYITTNGVNTDLLVQASGTGKVYSPTNSWLVDNNLTVEKQSNLGGLTVEGPLVISGSTTQVGNTQQTGSTQISGNITVSDTAQLGNVVFRTNYVSTSTGDLDLRASGTGIVRLPSNNVIVGSQIFATTTNFSSINVSQTVTASNLTDGTLLMAGNYITTVSGNNNFRLQAHGTGRVYLPTTSAVFDNTLTVNSLTTLKNTVIQGSITQTGNTSQTGNLTRVGQASLLGKFTNNNLAQFEDVQINTNFLTTTATNSNFELRAAGTGKVFVPGNNVQLDKNLTVSGLPTFTSVNLSRSITAGRFSKGDILIQDNFITTTNSNKNLDLRGVGTGGVYLEEIKFSPLNEIRTTAGNRDIVFTPHATKKFIIDKTSAVKVPVGTTAQRATLAQSDLRFNTSVNYFEGYSTSTRTFGGLFSQDRKTYIKQEPVSSLGTIRFEVNNVETMRAANNKLTMNGLMVDSQTKFDQHTISTLSGSADISLVPNGTGQVQLASKIKAIGNEFTNTSTTTQPILFSSTGTGYYKFEGTAGIVIPVGDTASRSYVDLGDTRWNTDLKTIEIYDGVQYISAGGAGGVTEAFMEDLSNIYAIILG